MMVMATTDMDNTNNYAQCLTTLTINGNLSRILTTEAIITKAIIAYTYLTRFNDWLWYFENFNIDQQGEYAETM